MNGKIEILKINAKGQGVGVNSQTGKEIRVWNALPAEKVEFEILKKKRGIIEGNATIINNPSKYREIPKDTDSYLSTSPWQIMNKSLENNLKLEKFKEAIAEASLEIELEKITIADSEGDYEYRNKMEFSFYADENEKIHLAFHKRSSKFGLIKVEKSSIASNAINNAAKEVINWINENKFSKKELKSLIVRSNNKGEAIAGLYIKGTMRESLKVTKFKSLKGFNVYFSDPLSPASKATKLLQQEGEDFLIEEINGVNLKYGLNSFFQVNINVFKKALEEISKHITLKDSVIDFYSGVGSIGLSLSKNFKECILVEENSEAVDFATDNIKENHIKNCKALLSKSEDILELIQEDKVIVFDPPREGLHKSVTEKVLLKKPKKVIYLSCNHETQIRDVLLLQEKYQVIEAKVFNFFPKTPHFESLMVLELKA